MDPVPYDPIEPEREQQIAWQPFCTITLPPPDTIIKWGGKVRPAEEAAMKLVKAHAPTIPIPEFRHSTYNYRDREALYGEITMSYVPGKTLKSAWAGYDDATKGRLCQDIWNLIAMIRTIPRPAHLEKEDSEHRPMYCTADGSPSRDPLLGGCEDVAPRFMDDQTFRDRIYSRYVAHHGLSYRDSAQYLPDRLPRSDKMVFVHGDILPGNIMVNDEAQITCLIDWESSGWFPDYWEYVQMMKYCGEKDWQQWMERSKPELWDIAAIQKARRVLF